MSNKQIKPLSTGRSLLRQPQSVETEKLLCFIRPTTMNPDKIFEETKQCFRPQQQRAPLLHWIIIVIVVWLSIPIFNFFVNTTVLLSASPSDYFK